MDGSLQGRARNARREPHVDLMPVVCPRQHRDVTPLGHDLPMGRDLVLIQVLLPIQTAQYKSMQEEVGRCSLLPNALSLHLAWLVV